MDKQRLLLALSHIHEHCQVILSLTQVADPLVLLHHDPHPQHRCIVCVWWVNLSLGAPSGLIISAILSSLPILLQVHPSIQCAKSR